MGIFPEGFAEGRKQKGAKTQFLVAGQLASFKNGKMTVVVGGKKVQIAVAKAAKINVVMNDPSLVRKVDKFDVRGQYFKSQQE